MKRLFPTYKQYLRPFSRQLRNNPTKAEKYLWNCVKKRKVKGYKFTRQKPIGRYIVDFFCRELKLVIEVDGITHYDDEVKENDDVREAWLGSQGFVVVRFEDKDIRADVDAVVRKIENVIEHLKGE